jgi:hypothetical protein
MKTAFVLLLGVSLWGCSGSDSEPTGQAGSGSGGGGVGTGAMPSGGSAGASVAGSATGGSSVGGAAAGAGGIASGGLAVGGAGGTAAGGGGGGVPATGGAGGSGGGGTCTPNPGGTFKVVGETVHDEKTCLDWMKTTQDNVNYAAAETFCADSTLGGFDDWHIPNVNEFASTVTACGKYPPEGPVNTTIFDIKGDGYWTTTPAGEPNKVCAVGMANAGGYYHYGTAGPQVVRCVRGVGTVETVSDCTTPAVNGCKDW